jgi:pyruvate formate lyase activating enzyme
MEEAGMPEMRAEPALTAKSPFELRVQGGRGMRQADVRVAVATGEMGFLHSFTTGATVDGPGVRVVAWTSGCMWRCQYCHNPDTWALTNGIPVSIARATDELRKYRHGLKVMSGGFTLSGGEPLMQYRFAAKLLAASHEMGIHTALDTNGFYGDKLSDEELQSVDLVLLDIKGWDPQRHQKLTGMEVAPTLAFARRLAALRKPIWLRYVLVPGLTDDMAEIGHIASFVAGLGNAARVDVLPFHQMGKYKWQQLGIPYALAETRPPENDLIDRACDVFRGAGLTTY